MKAHQKNNHRVKNSTAMNEDRFTCTRLLLQAIHIAIILLLVIDIGICEYENTWNFYYEQPCCSNTNSHHLRHHKGKILY